MNVELIDSMGSDLTVVNAARVSFAKVSAQLDDKDERLIHYLAEHGHLPGITACNLRELGSHYQADGDGVHVCFPWWFHPVHVHHASWCDGTRGKDPADLHGRSGCQILDRGKGTSSP